MPVSSHTISIQNLLEVRPGNVILVPGCEPTSAFTSDSLNINRECNASVISLEAAMEAIPGSTIRFMANGGFGLGVRRFLVLPEGPPPSPADCNDDAPACRTDWYEVLRQNSETVAEEESETPLTVDDICEVFPLKRNGIF
jgi:hypothetical protein